MPISESMTVWPGDPAVRFERASSIAQRDSSNVTRIIMGAHTGTHIDAPYHFFEQGETIETIPPEILIGPCRVIELMTDSHIVRKDLEPLQLKAQSRVLFKTKNSALWGNRPGAFHRDFIALAPGAAEYLVEKNIALVGIDYLSIEAFHAEGNPVHRILLGNSIVILEGLNLSSVRAGDFELICLPLMLQGVEASPARAVLREIL